MSPPVDVLEGFPAWIQGEPTITALLSDAAAVFPSWAPQEAERPYLVFHLGSDASHHHMGGNAKIANPLLQVECWADDLGAARALADALDQRLNHFRGDLGGVFAQGVFRRDRRTGTADPDDGSGTRRHVVLLHYEVWRSL